uniref:Transmembrane protein n=1 Tax=Romanomermis culicivorax TaxID=13658 RepID=A0A915JR01_ROMCU
MLLSSTTVFNVARTKLIYNNRMKFHDISAYHGLNGNCVVKPCVVCSTVVVVVVEAFLVVSTVTVVITVFSIEEGFSASR